MGSIAVVRIFSGVSAATFSISTPPSVEAMNTTRWLARSTTAPRYSSRAIWLTSSTSTLLTG